MGTNESDRALKNQHRNCGKNDAPAENRRENHRCQPVHNPLDGEWIKIFREQSIVNRTEYSERCGAKQRGADQKTISEPLGIVGIRLRHTIASELAKAVGGFLQSQQLSEHVSQYEREEDDAHLSKYMAKRTVDAKPGEPQTEPNRQRAEDGFEIILRGGGRLFFDQQAGNAADNNCRDVQYRPNHGLTESSPQKRARHKVGVFDYLGAFSLHIMLYYLPAEAAFASTSMLCSKCKMSSGKNAKKSAYKAS